MSLNGIISTSLSGLFTNQEAIRVTSNNVANVNTENYARVRVNTEAAVIQGASSGVSIASIERVVDQFLETALRTSISNTEEFSVQREFHDRFQGILGDPASDSSLASRVDQFFSSIADLTLNPADVLRRQQSLNELQSLLDQVGELQVQIQNLRSEASQQIDQTVDSINEELQRINGLNPLLVRQSEESGGLEGQLADSLSSVSELIDVRVNRGATGSVTLTTQSGYPLVDTSLSQLSYNAPGVVSSDTVFPPVTINRVDDQTLSAVSSPVELSSHIRSGRLAGLLDLRDKQLVDLSLTVGEFAAQLADQLNANQNGFVSVPPPNTLTGEPTLVDGAHATNFTGVVTFAVVNDQNVTQSSVQVDFDSAPPADFDALVTQVNAALGTDGTLALNNGVISFSASDSSHGVVIHDDESNPSQRAGRGFSHFFGLNNLVEADDPGIYETGISGTEAHNITAGQGITFQVVGADGSEIDTVNVTISGAPNVTYNDLINNDLGNVAGLGAYVSFSLDANGELSYTGQAGFDNVSLRVISDSTEIASTGLSFTRAFGVGDTFRADAAKNVRIREAVSEDPSRLALSVFDPTATSPSAALTSGDQRGALALQNLETSLVAFNAAGELRGGNVTLTQYVGRLLGNAGLMAQRAENFQEDNLALQQEVAQRNSDVSGVNLDEELSNLVIFQNAYNAAARILSSVQELYDSLLAAV